MIVKYLNRAASMTAAAIFLVIANASASTTIFNANVAGTKLVPETATYPTGNCCSIVVANIGDIVTTPSGLDDTVLSTITSPIPQSSKWPLPLIGCALVALGLVGRKNRKRLLVSGDTHGTVPQTPAQLLRGTTLVAR